LWDDLATKSGNATGMWVNTNLPGRVLFTWREWKEVGSKTSSNTAQIALFGDGRIIFAYDSVDTLDALVGVSPGPVCSSALFKVDFTGEPFSRPCGTIFEQFEVHFPNGSDPVGSGTTSGPPHPFDLNKAVVLWTPNASGGFDAEDDPTPPAAWSGWVTGTVYDATGIPVPNRIVKVHSSTYVTQDGFAITDAFGRYTIIGVPLGPVSVTVLDGDTVVAVGAGELTAEIGFITVDVYPLEPKTEEPDGASPGDLAQRPPADAAEVMPGAPGRARAIAEARQSAAWRQQLARGQLTELPSL